MKIKHMLLVAGAAGALAIPSAANAATLLFNFAGNDTRSFVFTLDDSRAPDGGVTFGSANRIEFDNVSGTFAGLNGTDSVANISFGTGFLSTLQVGSINFAGTFNGPDLFNGSRTNPVFNLGQFALTPGALNPAGGTLTVSQVAAVPEPATWAMLLIGFFGMGTFMRRTRPTRQQVSYS